MVELELELSCPSCGGSWVLAENGTDVVRTRELRALVLADRDCCPRCARPGVRLRERFTERAEFVVG